MEYLPLPGSEPEVLDLEPPQKRTKTKVTWLAFGAVIFATISAVFYLQEPLFAISGSTSTVPVGCGQSAQEAQLNKSRFDVIHYAWVPQDCFDQEYFDTYQPFQEFNWYADPHLRTKLPQDAVTSGKLEVIYTTVAFHLYRCRYSWHRMLRYAKYGISADNQTMSIDHAKDCASSLLKGREREPEQYAIQLSLQFLSCW